MAAIQADQRYQANLSWGEPRPGHPEGTLAAHIADLERNLAALTPRLTAAEVERLRVLIHVHDTFKPQALEVAIAHPRSHASLARAFLSEFTDDEELLTAVQLHDEPYALWRRRDKNPWERFEELLGRVHDWDLFLAFLIVDGCTVGKTREPLHWFFRSLAGRVPTRVEETWIG